MKQAGDERWLVGMAQQNAIDLFNSSLNGVSGRGEPVAFGISTEP